MEKKDIRYEKPILEKLDDKVGIGQACKNGSTPVGACNAGAGGIPAN